MVRPGGPGRGRRRRRRPPQPRRAASPPRDGQVLARGALGKGPVRKFARDYVNSRFRVAEFFLPPAVVILVLSVLRNPALQNISLLLQLVVIVLIVVDSAVSGLPLRREPRCASRTSPPRAPWPTPSRRTRPVITPLRHGHSFVRRGFHVLGPRTGMTAYRGER
ncbi:DUF3043 domain-containing protein [Actinacidiphila glaucinigra]|uniref:DUF3043 domain-containing protein n=1 Tax=Actinacidiphila glaucinigra TaxID=235986 RepID=UPI0035E04F86